MHPSPGTDRSAAGLKPLRQRASRRLRRQVFQEQKSKDLAQQIGLGKYRIPGPQPWRPKICFNRLNNNSICQRRR